MIRGYHGYYNNTYLRSSLEFAYAYYLDHFNIKWKYEINTYDLNDCKYKPDFFIFDEEDSLIKIVEIKGTGNRLEGEMKIKEFKEKYDIPIFLLDYKDILELYSKEMPIRYHKAKKIFIDDYNAKLENQEMDGENNPMFGIQHSKKTKELIGKKCVERFNDHAYKEKHREACKKRVYKKGYTKVDRETRNCLTCNNEFEVIITSKKKYCSRGCALKTCYAKGIEVQNETYQIHKDKLKKEILIWAENNKDLVINTPYNKINSTLKELYDYIYENYGIKDERSISNVFDTSSRKEFLKILKQHVQN